MNKSQFFLGPERDLTGDEIDALFRIQAGQPVPDRIRHRLEVDELVVRSVIRPASAAQTENELG